MSILFHHISPSTKWLDVIRSGASTWPGDHRLLDHCLFGVRLGWHRRVCHLWLLSCLDMLTKRQLLDEDIRESWWIANHSWSCMIMRYGSFLHCFLVILCFVFSFVASCRIEDQRGLLGEFPSRRSASGRLLAFRAAFRVVSRRNERSSGCFLRGRA